MNLQALDRWTLEHETAVFLHLSGRTMVYICNELGRSNDFVSHAINSPQGRELKEEFIKKIRERSIALVSDKVVSLTNRALEQLAKTLDCDDFILTSSHKRHQDRMAISLLRISVGMLEERAKPDAAPLDNAMSRKLIEALEKSNKVFETGRGDGSLVQEAEFVEVEG